MNYQAHYDRLIARARGRVLTGYRERHHVLPRYMGGGDEKANLVELTPEEHYVAHQLLVKMHMDVTALLRAAVLMAGRCSGSKAYGWLRRAFSEARKGVPLNLSPEGRVRRIAALLGNKRTLGYRHTPAALEKIRAAMSGRKLSTQHVASMSAARMGHLVSEETRRKISETKRRNAEPKKKTERAKAWSQEHLAKLSAARRGKKHPPRSAEWCAKISAGLRGKKRAPFSEEWRAKMSASQRQRALREGKVLR